MSKKMNILVIDKYGDIKRIRIFIRDLRYYKAVSKIGRKILYERIYRKEKISKERRAKVFRIKGVTINIDKEMKAEKNHLRKIRLLPKINRGRFARVINPEKKIITNEKDYNSFRAMQDDHRNITLRIMDNLVKARNPKFLNRMYELRESLLKDSIQIEVDLYGSLGKNFKRVVYLGTIKVTGLMPEYIGILEGDIIGFSGYLPDLVEVVDRNVRGRGGNEAILSTNNTVGISPLGVQVMVKNSILRFSYA